MSEMVERSNEWNLHFNGNMIPISENAAQLSKFLNTQMESIDGDDDKTIYIENESISESNMRIIIDFLEHYAIEPMNTIPKPLNKDIELILKNQEYYLRYYEQILDQENSYERLFEITKISNFMMIDCLSALCHASIANIIRKDPSPEKINGLFRVKN